MSANRFVRLGQLQHNDPKLGRVLAISVILHLVLLLAFQLAMSSRFAPPQKTVYYVDLTQLPVKDPRAGRPTPPTPKAKVPPPASRKPAVAKSTPKSVPKAATTSQPRSDTTKAAIEKLRAEKSRSAKEQALRDKLDALTAEDTREATPAPASDAPLGSVTGVGTEMGLAQQVWLQAMIKEQWNLSRYQVSRLDLEAEVEMTYSAGGHFLGYAFVARSNDQHFDDSIIRTMLKMKEIVLPFSLEKRTTIKVTFNLNELIGK